MDGRRRRSPDPIRSRVPGPACFPRERDRSPRIPRFRSDRPLRLAKRPASSRSPTPRPGSETDRPRPRPRRGCRTVSRPTRSHRSGEPRARTRRSERRRSRRACAPGPTLRPDAGRRRPIRSPSPTGALGGADEHHVASKRGALKGHAGSGQVPPVARGGLEPPHRDPLRSVEPEDVRHAAPKRAGRLHAPTPPRPPRRQSCHRGRPRLRARRSSPDRRLRGWPAAPIPPRRPGKRTAESQARRGQREGRPASHPVRVVMTAPRDGSGEEPPTGKRRTGRRQRAYDARRSALVPAPDFGEVDTGRAAGSARYAGVAEAGPPPIERGRCGLPIGRRDRAPRPAGLGRVSASRPASGPRG